MVRRRRANRFVRHFVLAAGILAGARTADALPEHPQVDTAKEPYWNQGEPRPFASARVEAGLYLKPQVAVGYGKPYWLNVTAEAYGITTTSFGAGYTGIRGTLPFVDLRVGARYTYSYYRSFLTPKEHYDADDVNHPQGPLARYLSLETELAGVVPAFGGYIFPVITIYRIVDTPEGTYLFDESLRGILKPPWIMGFRLGFVEGFGPDDFVKLGLLSELVVVPGRSDTIVRLGPAAHITLTDHLDLQSAITLVIASPDSLGIWNGPFGVLGFVYRWATGDRSPGFP